MDQTQLALILNRHIFQREKATLLQNIADNPQRFIGLFRPTTPRLKLLQNLLQSREIRFGDAMEEVIAALLRELGFEILEQRATTETGQDVAFDQYGATPDRTTFLLVEQKVRDDHDSTKKVGQIANFRQKLAVLHTRHTTGLTGIMYFIDPATQKNRNYYTRQLQQISDDLGVTVHLCYNGEFFDLFERRDLWNALLAGLLHWRNTLPEPDLDWDKNAEEAARELATVSPTIWRRVLTNDALWQSGVLQTLFVRGDTLAAVCALFRTHDWLPTPPPAAQQRLYPTVVALLEHRLRTVWQRET